MHGPASASRNAETNPFAGVLHYWCRDVPDAFGLRQLPHKVTFASAPATLREAPPGSTASPRAWPRRVTQVLLSRDGLVVANYKGLQGLGVVGTKVAELVGTPK